MAIGAYAVERDYSHYVAYASKTVLAVVSTATKGPIGEAVAVTSSQDLVNKFGNLNTDCYGLYAAQYFLSQSSKVYFVRAAHNDAAPATVDLAGLNESEDPLTDSVTLTMLEKGTFSNGYKVTVYSETDRVVDEVSYPQYTLKLESAKGGNLEVIKNVTFDELKGNKFTSKYFKVSATNANTATLSTSEDNNTVSYPFSGGNDGISAITSGDYINAAKALASDVLDINLIVVPGVSDTATITGVLEIAESRGDCLYLIDPPKELSDPDAMIKWVNGNHALNNKLINNSYGAVYYDWVNIYDSVNKTQVTVPPSVVVCATYAYNDRTADLWYAPAGLSRGIVRGTVGTRTTLSKTDIELLYESNINALYEDPSVGLVLWGQKTLLRETTALDRVNVRRLMNYLKRVITAACNYLVFEPNDRVTWNSFEMKVIPTLTSIKNRRGIYEFKVVKGETIVTDEDIDNYRMPCMVLVRPTKAAEEIPIYFVITSTGADFNEVLEANGIVSE